MQGLINVWSQKYNHDVSDNPVVCFDAATAANYIQASRLGFAE